MSVRDCKAPISDTPEAITHDGSIVPGSTWDSIYFLPGNGKAVPPAVPSSLGTQAGFGAMSITDARSTLIGVQSPLSLRIYVRKHRRVVGANQYMLLFQLWLKIL